MKKDKRNRWMKGLNRDLVGSILELKPDQVTFRVDYPCSVSCIVVTENGVGEGISICSILDKFDDRVGKNKAAGRALGAILNGVSSDPIRGRYEEFPNTWTKRHIDRVMDFSHYVNKSILV